MWNFHLPLIESIYFIIMLYWIKFWLKDYFIGLGIIAPGQEIKLAEILLKPNLASLVSLQKKRNELFCYEHKH